MSALATILAFSGEDYASCGRLTAESNTNLLPTGPHCFVPMEDGTHIGDDRKHIASLVEISSARA